MNEFKTYHPIVNLIYFVFVIGFSCILNHPICTLLSLVCGFIYSVVLNGKKGVKANLTYMLPTVLMMTVMNPLFSHNGATILAYFPNGNPLTLESICYGLCTGAMISSVICHFGAYNKVFTSDKFIYLFGRIIPSLALVISMTLRFVPLFKEQMKKVSESEKLMGKSDEKAGVIKKAKSAMRVVSVVTTWAMENSIETADSMNARGYGLKNRTAFSIYTFDKRDLRALLNILFLGGYVIMGICMGEMSFSFFPTLKLAPVTPLGVSVFIAYFFLFIYPVIIEVKEARRWRALRSKI